MVEQSSAAAPSVSGWFWAGALSVLIFMGIGVAGYLVSVTADPAALPDDSRALMAARPTWMIWAYAIAVWSGLAGAVALLLRRTVAVPLLALSTVGAIFTFLPYVVVDRVRELATEGDGAAGIIVIALCWSAFWFARRSAARGFLR